MTSAKLKTLPAKKAAAKKASSARTLARSSNSGRFIAYDTPLEPKHTTRQRIVDAIAKAAA